MSHDPLIEALDLPESTRVDQRVPKKLLLENVAPTAADKRLINDGIDEFTWLATLKPVTIGVPEYRDDTREYLEIAVLGLALRPGAKPPRLMELVHRAVPYPVLLLTTFEGVRGISAVHKRWSLGEAGKVVLEGAVVAADRAEQEDEHLPAFRNALALAKQPRTSLFTMYQGWIDTLLALQAARETGAFMPALDPRHAAARRDALLDCVRLDAQIICLRAAAAKEKQMARRVELNLELKRVEAARTAARANL